MLDEGGLPSVWTSLLSWFTPAVFFVLLNLVIGTIALTSKPRPSSPSSSSSPAPSTAGDYHGRATTLVRAPSLVLDRLRSFNLSQYVHHHDYSNDVHSTDNTTVPLAAADSTAANGNGNGNALTRAPSLVLNRLRSFGISRFVSGDFSAETLHVEPAVDDVLDSAPPPQVEEHEHDHYNEQHPIERTHSDAKPPLPKLVVRMKKSASDKSAFSHFEEEEEEEDDDGEVDAKADDFINKFKNQLRLQRLDSIMRYKEMLTRGSAAN